MLIWHGSLTVMGEESTSAIAGIAGLGHIALAAGMVLLFLALRSRIVAPAAAQPVVEATAAE